MRIKYSSEESFADKASSADGTDTHVSMQQRRGALKRLSENEQFGPIEKQFS